MNLEELEDLQIRYDSHNYYSFVEDYKKEIDNLSHEDRFLLYKELYVSAKNGDEDIAYLLQDEVIYSGVPDNEIDNIKKNVKFENDGTTIVYRGLNKYNRFDGSSYTLNKEKAIWFSQRFKENLKIIELKVKLKDIIFYDNTREEEEVFLKNEIVGRY